MEHMGKVRKAHAERGMVRFLRILIFLLPTIRVCLTGVGLRKRGGSVCAIRVVTLRIICVEVVLSGLGGG